LVGAPASNYRRRTQGAGPQSLAPHGPDGE